MIEIFLYGLISGIFILLIFSYIFCEISQERDKRQQQQRKLDLLIKKHEKEQ